MVAAGAEDALLGPEKILHHDLQALAVDASSVPFVRLQEAVAQAEQLQRLPAGSVRDEATARTATFVREARLEPPSAQQLQRAVSSRLRTLAERAGVPASAVSLRPKALVRNPSVRASLDAAEGEGRRVRQPQYTHANNVQLASQFATAATGILDPVTDFVLLEADEALTSIDSMIARQLPDLPALQRVREVILRVAAAPGCVRAALQDKVLDILSPLAEVSRAHTMPAAAVSRAESLAAVNAEVFGQATDSRQPRAGPAKKGSGHWTGVRKKHSKVATAQAAKSPATAKRSSSSSRRTTTSKKPRSATPGPGAAAQVATEENRAPSFSGRGEDSASPRATTTANTARPRNGGSERARAGPDKRTGTKARPKKRQ